MFNIIDKHRSLTRSCLTSETNEALGGSRSPAAASVSEAFTVCGTATIAGDITITITITITIARGTPLASTTRCGQKN